jgi:hypothetical protein
MYLLMRDLLASANAATVAVLSFSLDPLVMGWHDSINSDLPFLGFEFLFLYFVHRIYAETTAPPFSVVPSVVCGMLAWAAYSVRPLGGVLILVPAVLDLWRYRTFSRFAAASCVTLLAGITLQTYLSPAASNASVLKLFIFDPFMMYRTAFVYLRDARELIPIAWRPVSFFVYAVGVGLAAIGFVCPSGTYQRVNVPTVFACAYTAVLLLYPWAPLRYLVPVIPIAAFLAVRGAAVAAQKIPSVKPVILACFAICATLGVSADLHPPRTPVTEGIGDSRLQSVAAFISANAPPGAVVIFPKPRLLALMSGRTVSVSSTHGTDAYLRNIHAEYIVLADNIPDTEISTQAPLRSIIDADSSRFRLLLSVGDYHLFKVVKSGR